LELEDNQMLELMSMAHEQDITLNQLVENILRNVIAEKEITV
jgi:predicted HicB family RNase H-like nuclease